MWKKILIALAAALIFTGCANKKNVTRDSSSLQGKNGDSLIQDFEKNIGDRVFFSLNSHELSTAAKIQLDKQAKWLSTHKHLNVEIQGHCDERGTREYNLGLGAKRAHAVKTYLVSQGLDVSRLKTVSFGKERPAVIGHDESAWSKNRRAVSIVIK